MSMRFKDKAPGGATIESAEAELKRKEAATEKLIADAIARHTAEGAAAYQRKDTAAAKLHYNETLKYKAMLTSLARQRADAQGAKINAEMAKLTVARAQVLKANAVQNERTLAEVNPNAIDQIAASAEYTAAALGHTATAVSAAMSRMNAGGAAAAVEHADAISAEAEIGDESDPLKFHEWATGGASLTPPVYTPVAESVPRQSEIERMLANAEPYYNKPM
jgi:hypothetical protein